MDYSRREVIACGSSRIVNRLPEIGLDTAVDGILEGLARRPKRISSRYFYDPRGSALFEAITGLEEYYLSRTEKALIEALPFEAIARTPDLDIVELGSGDHSKIALLLGGVPSRLLSGIRYVPVDISCSALERSIAALVRLFPALEVEGVVADYFHQMHPVSGGRRKLFCFFGSTIGNLSRGEAAAFMRDIAASMESGDSFLIGMDRVKDVRLLERAYNDSHGVTAMFNRNILSVVNGLLGSDFQPEKFEHRAFYNRSRKRIEMHLEATEDMTVGGGALREGIPIARGEAIHTENSHKFDEDDIRVMGAAAGFDLRQIFSDENRLFSLVHYEKP